MLDNQERTILALACIAVASLIIAQSLAKALAETLRDLDAAERDLLKMTVMKTRVVFLAERDIDDAENR